MTGRGSSLSVCCLAVEPPAQVASALGYFREIADEVIVAVDSRVDPAELGPYFGVADRLVRYEFNAHPDHARPWIYAQCSGDWLLSIDGDEVPSGDLTDALPSLLTTTDVMQYMFPRRWLFPDSSHWLEELPWWPDMQTRLVRNVPSLRHSGRLHDGITVTLPSRHLDCPIYHLAFLTAGLDERQQRVVRYEAESPGRMAHGGGRLNETMYLPEVSATRPPSEVPQRDRSRIQFVLAERLREVSPTDRAMEIPLITKPEIDQHVSRLDLMDSDYCARLTMYAEQGHMSPGELRPIYARVTNMSSVTWSWGLDQQPHIRVGYHWRTADGTTIPDDGRRSPLTSTLHPDDSIIVPVLVEAPSTSGSYVLEVDLVHEGVRWFGSPLCIDMVVKQVR